MKLLLLATALALAGQALAGDTLFYASFDHWLLAEIAVAGRTPLSANNCRLGPGKFGKALALDGTGYLEFRPPAGELAQFTVALWFKPDNWGAKQYDNLFAFSDTDENGLEFERSDPNGLLRIVVGGPDTKDGGGTRSVFSKAPPQNGEWAYLAVTCDREAKRLQLFVNGELQSELTGEGPLPNGIRQLLIGAGWGRLGRAVSGLIDDVIITNAAATPEEIASLMTGVNAATNFSSYANSAISVQLERSRGEITIGSTGEGVPRVLIGPTAPAVTVGGQRLQWTQWAEAQTAAPIAVGLGAAKHYVVTAAPNESGLGLRYHLQFQEQQPLALVWLEVTNPAAQPVKVERLALLETEARPGGVSFGVPGRGQRIFVDNGGLMNSGSHDLETKGADHVAHGAMVVTEPDGDWATSTSFVSFQTAGVTNALKIGDDGLPAGFRAICDYPNGYLVQPGQSLQSEVFAVGVYPQPHEALERWTDVVMAVNDLQPPRFRPSGWNSWYCYRLTISEDLVLENARVIKEHFPGLGLENIQIDHGWQYKDIVGNWVENERFPHKLPWLTGKLKEMGLTLGLWTAVTNVSEHAPLFAEHPEALFQDPAGGPHVTYDKWYWAPHGKVYSVDPTSPLGEQHLRQTGEALKSYGCTYNKNDFQTDLMATNVAIHDKTGTLGAPVWRKGMTAFAQGKGRDMAYMACNAPLNLVAGLCDSAWTHGDIGNPGGRWDWLRQFAHDFMSRYHVSGKFYWSDADYLQVGQGTPQENRVRMAFAALGGGPTFLSDRLPELSEEKLALIAQCLPGYGPCARPLDLFEKSDYPHVWDLPVKTAWGEWHVLGLFNLYEAPGRVEVNMGQLGLEPAQDYVLWDYFGRKVLDEVKGAGELDVVLRVPVPQTEVRVVKVVAKRDRPFMLSTDLHLVQGAVELKDVKWDEKSLTLSGQVTRPPQTEGHVYVYVPQGYQPKQGAEGKSNIVAVPVKGSQAWRVSFVRK